MADERAARPMATGSATPTATPGVVGAVKVPLLVDQLYEAVRADIFASRVRAGDPLTEKSLSDNYEVARPTARAALERLATDGLLRRDANKSARVPRLGVEDVCDLFACRALMERAGIAALARVGGVPDGVAEARRLLENADTDIDQTTAVSMDLDFRSAIVAAMGSPRMSRMHALMIGEVRLVMTQVGSDYLASPDRLRAEQREVLDAIERKDVAVAAARSDSQLKALRDMLIAGIQAEPAGAARLHP